MILSVLLASTTRVQEEAVPVPHLGWMAFHVSDLLLTLMSMTTVFLSVGIRDAHQLNVKRKQKII